MKKTFLIIISLLLTTAAMAQLEVKNGSFKEVTGFVNINSDPYYQYDENDQMFAVVKVRTENISDKQRRELRFEGNPGTFIMLEYRVGEVWVYQTSVYAEYLKISHPQFSTVKFSYPEELQPKKGYELTLVNKTDAFVGTGLLTVTTTPEDGAAVSLNGQLMEQLTPYYNDMIPAGKYEITVSKAGYKPATRNIEIEPDKNTELTIDMEYLYGKMTVVSEPDSANVLIDGKKCGMTPATLDSIVVGFHELTIDKPAYAQVKTSFVLDENTMLSYNEKLVPALFVIIITGEKGDKLYVDGEYIGDSPLYYKFTYGEHEIKSVRGENEEQTGIKKVNITSETNMVMRLTFFDKMIFNMNGVTFEMLAVEGGTYKRGCLTGDCPEDKNSLVQDVTVGNYYMGKFEVTQDLWKAVMGFNPSTWVGDDLPVDSVSWNACYDFTMRLSKLTGQKFRLPTEDEWEFAARGGNKSNGFKHSGSDNPDEVMWYFRNSGDKYLKWKKEDQLIKKLKKAGCKTHPVGQKAPNELGFYDMSGNVSEFCLDNAKNVSRYGETWPVNRGGNCFSSAASSTVLRRQSRFMFRKFPQVGFRLLLEPEK
ncbi:MAG: SUMF1/EgtB/PvdO family nonheme iron enzyme [Bacteroidales bacterium]|nr:SUMF1/EgtB/PvdO family nonheme iron enzyme [Bacteroidales bacterium]